VRTPFHAAAGQLAVPVTDEDHAVGPAHAPVTLVEYGDFECPYCVAALPSVQRLLKLRPQTIRFAFRHFPLVNVHPHAEMAAEAAEFAAARGRFWPMHDWLFEHQPLDPVQIMLGVEDVALDPSEAAAELVEQRYADRVRRDFASGVHSGVTGTPTFFVNGLRYDGGYGLADLLAAVDAAI
jgi:protein-disulfide isomerase